MELRHIRYLIAAGEEEHFGRAAERLHVTRSAVSQMVADLEEELGFALFERQAQRIRLTAAGRAMLPRLNALMNELQATIALGRRIGEGMSGALKVGYGSLATHHPVFRAVIKRFHEQCPDVALTLVEVPTSRQLRALQEGSIQAGFMHNGPERPGLGPPDANDEDGGQGVQTCLIDSAAAGLLVPQDHRLARRRSVRLVDLQGEPLVMVHDARGSPLFRRFFEICQAAGFEPRIVQEVSSTSTQQDLVAAGVGIGVSAVGGLHRHAPGLRALPFADVDYRLTFEFAWPAGHVEPALQRFIALVRSRPQA